MKYLLDTAVWANAVTRPATVPARVRSLIAGEDEVGLCSVSLLEIALLHRLGKFKLSGELREFFEVALAQNVRVLELSPIVAARTNTLPPEFNGDPFDRTFAATAGELGLTAVTTDPQIRDHGRCAVEFYHFKPERAV